MHNIRVDFTLTALIGAVFSSIPGFYLTNLYNSQGTSRDLLYYALLILGVTLMGAVFGLLLDWIHQRGSHLKTSVFGLLGFFFLPYFLHNLKISALSITLAQTGFIMDSSFWQVDITRVFPLFLPLSFPFPLYMFMRYRQRNTLIFAVFWGFITPFLLVLGLLSEELISNALRTI